MTDGAFVPTVEMSMPFGQSCVVKRGEVTPSQNEPAPKPKENGGLDKGVRFNGMFAVRVRFGGEVYILYHSALKDLLLGIQSKMMVC